MRVQLPPLDRVPAAYARLALDLGDLPELGGLGAAMARAMQQGVEQGGGAQKVFLQAFETHLAADLGSVGLLVQRQVADLELVIEDFLPAGAHASVRQAGQAFAELDVPAEAPCLIGEGARPAPCIARELVLALLRDERVAGALRGEGRAPAGASSPGTPYARQASLRGKVAVLELRSSAPEVTRENARYLTDVVRQATLRTNPGAEVMTRENMMVLLEATGRRLEECEGECEVDTGRRLGADAIISGELGRLGRQLKLSLRLHDTRAGKLLSSATGSAATLEELEPAIEKAGQALFATSVAAGPAPAAAAACRSDRDCPGDEICNARRCERPPAAAAPAPPPATASCGRDTDCPGALVCERGRCIAEAVR